MNDLPHNSAEPSHYDCDASEYDTLNEERSQGINTLVDSLLRKYGVRTVLDMTCGTGSQVFWLAKRGYAVTGSDINAAMLAVAKKKAATMDVDVKLLEGDMRTLKAGTFDVVLTIFNAIGHLTKADFAQAIRNVGDNLKPNGLYLFDIFNLTYLLHSDNITKLTIDWQAATGGTTVRKIQYSTINAAGVLASFTTSITQEGDNKAHRSDDHQTLQVYTAEQLRELLQDNGFEVLSQTDADGNVFLAETSERILTVARKRS